VWPHKRGATVADRRRPWSGWLARTEWHIPSQNGERNDGRFDPVAYWVATALTAFCLPVRRGQPTLGPSCRPHGGYEQAGVSPRTSSSSWGCGRSSGGIVVLTPGTPRLKEWGLCRDGLRSHRWAAASHAAVGGPSGQDRDPAHHFAASSWLRGPFALQVASWAMPGSSRHCRRAS